MCAAPSSLASTEPTVPPPSRTATTRMARIGLAQDFHFPRKGRRNHCKVSPVLQQGQQSEARFVGNDLEVVAGLSFHCPRIRLSEICSKRGRPLQNKVVRPGCADAGRTNYHHGEKKPVTAQFKKPDRDIFHGNHSRTFAGERWRFGNNTRLPMH